MSKKPKYPSLHEIGIDYGATDSQDDILSRPASVVDDPNGTDRHLADYTYMGLANLVSSAYPVPGIEMTLIAQTGDPQSGPAGDKYTGLDRFGRLLDKRWIKTGTSNPIVDLVRAQYTYDRAGNRLTHTNPVATAVGVNLDQSYSYDGLYQVATHQTGIGTGIPATEEQFTYDPTGNWNRYKTLAVGAVTEDTPRTNNSANQITQIVGTPKLIAHNATGNTTRIPTPADPTKSFDLKWDAWNRLVKISDSETGDPVAVYTYDGLYRRISTDDGNGTDTRRYYYNQQWRCVEEFNGEDNAAKKLLKRYFWGAQNRWELIARQRDTDGNETLDEELFLLTDAMDPVAIVDTSGSFQERYSYSAFGDTTVLNPAFVAITGTSCDWGFLFHGEFRDFLGFYNYGYRYFAPELGRWLSRDPIGEGGSTNLYEAANNSICNLFDFLGLENVLAPGVSPGLPRPGNGTDYLYPAGDEYFPGDYHSVGSSASLIGVLITGGISAIIDSIRKGNVIGKKMCNSSDTSHNIIAHSQGVFNAVQGVLAFAKCFCKRAKSQCTKKTKIKINLLLISPKVGSKIVRNKLSEAKNQCPKCLDLELKIWVIYSKKDRIIPKAGFPPFPGTWKPGRLGEGAKEEEMDSSDPAHHSEDEALGFKPPVGAHPTDENRLMQEQRNRIHDFFKP